MTFEKKPYKMSASYRDNSGDGAVVAFAYKNGQNISFVTEYRVKDGYVLRNYEGWKNDTIKSISHSTNG